MAKLKSPETQLETEAVPDFLVDLAGPSNRLRALQSLNTKLVCLQLDDAGYQEMVEGVRKVIGCDACGLLLADHDAEKLVLKAAVGFADVPLGKELSFADEENIHCQAVLEEYVVHVPAVSELPGVVTLDSVAASSLIIPIRTSKHCVGVFDFSYLEPWGFSEEDVDLAGMLVDQMAYLLENHRLLAELAASRDAVIRGMALLAESREGHIGGHIERICEYSQYLALQLLDEPAFRSQIDSDLVKTIAEAAALHDIGKMGVPDEVLLKPSRLTPAEHDVIKGHTTAGYKLLCELIEQHGSFPVLTVGAEVAGAHHENWDGSGYPDGMSGEEIPLAARIVALADVYDALTSKRIYKEAWSQSDAVAKIQEASGVKFDPRLTEIFLRDPEKLLEISCIRTPKEE